MHVLQESLIDCNRWTKKSINPDFIPRKRYLFCVVCFHDRFSWSLFNDLKPTNGLAFSGAAPIDWHGSRAESSFQKRPDLDRRKAAYAATPGWAATHTQHTNALTMLPIIDLRALAVHSHQSLMFPRSAVIVRGSAPKQVHQAIHQAALPAQQIVTTVIFSIVYRVVLGLQDGAHVSVGD